MKKLLYILCFGLFVSSLYLVNVGKLGASEPISWQAGLQLVGKAPIGQNTTVSNSYGKCTNKTITTRKLALKPYFLPQLTETLCLTTTPYGQTDGKYLLLNNSDIAGKLEDYHGLTSFVPVPGSNTLFVIQSNPGYGYTFRVYKNPSKSLTSRLDGNGYLIYTVSAHYDNTIQDASGSDLWLVPSTINFSADRKWMTGDVIGRATVRVNLDTLQALPYSPSANYYAGYEPAIKTAISADGRFAVAYTVSGAVPSAIYDLNNCTNIPTGQISGPATCANQNLGDFMASQTDQGSFGGFMGLAFADNYTLNANTLFRKDGKIERSYYQMQAKGYVQPSLDYLAMGDSFSSGEGAKNYEPYTDFADNRCHISKDSYPYLLAKSSGLTNFHSVACSGAKFKDIKLIKDDDYSSDPQSHGKDGISFNNEILTNFLPGYRAQRRFYDQYTTSATTITIGGNDANFGSIIQRCIEADTCYNTYEERYQKLKEIQGLYDKWVETFSALKDTGTRVYVLGYPTITSTKALCGKNVLLSQEELLFANNLTDFLNQNVKSAAGKAGVFYVDTQDSLAGHELCSGSGQTAVNGITWGKGKPLTGIGPVASESYHPTVYGQSLLASTAATKTGQLQTLMPEPNDAAAAPVINDLLPLLSNSPRSAQPIRRNVPALFDTLLGDKYNQGDMLKLKINPSDYNLKPGSTANILLFSEPTNLGNITINGDASTDLKIPETTTPGYHTLHIYGTNLADELVDIYKPIWVGATSDDFDGDGVKDDVDTCPINRNSGIDYDEDGIDDVCDENISEPKPRPPVNPIPVTAPPITVIELPKEPTLSGEDTLPAPPNQDKTGNRPDHEPNPGSGVYILPPIQAVPDPSPAVVATTPSQATLAPSTTPIRPRQNTNPQPSEQPSSNAPQAVAGAQTIPNQVAEVSGPTSITAKVPKPAPSINLWWLLFIPAILGAVYAIYKKLTKQP